MNQHDARVAKTLRRQVVKTTSDLKRASIIKLGTDPEQLASRVVLDITG